MDESTQVAISNILKTLTMSLYSLKNFLFAAALAGINSSCQQDDKAQVSNSPDSFPVIQPLLMDTVYSREYVADIQSMQHVEIRAQVKGFLDKIHVDEGQEVRAGQLIFTLNGKVFREELRQAKAVLSSAIAEAKVAGVELANTRTLVEKDIIGKPELNVAEAKFEALNAKIEEAQAAVSAAELKLSFTEIRAPFAGVLNREPLKTGSLVNEGDLLTTISSNREVFVYFHLYLVNFFLLLVMLLTLRFSVLLTFLFPSLISVLSFPLIVL